MPTKKYRNPRVSKMVERTLAKKPDTRLAILKRKAEGIDGTVTRLTGQQFFGTYVLPAKKEANGTLHTAPRRKASRALRLRAIEHDAPLTKLPVLASKRPVEHGALQDAVKRSLLRAMFSDVMAAGLRAESRADVTRLFDAVDASVEHAFEVLKSTQGY